MKTITLLSVSILIVLTGCTSVPATDPGNEVPSQPSDAGEATEPLPPPPSATRYFVDGMRSWDDADRAIRMYSMAIELNPDFALAHFERAGRLRELGALPDAVHDYSRAIEIEPGFVQAWIERGFLRLWELGDEGGAADVETAYMIDPGNVEAALAFVGLIEWESPELAFEILDRLTREHPDNPEPFLRRAKILRNFGEFTEAARDFREAMERGLHDGWVRMELVNMLIAMGEIGEARRELESAHRDDPENPDIMLGRARMAVLSDQARGSASIYADYLDSDWIHQPVKLELALVESKLGNERRATELVRSFLEFEDDPLRAQLARAGALALNNRPEDGLELLEGIISEAEWYKPAWIMIAVLAEGNPERIPEQIRGEFAEKMEHVRGELRGLYFDHTELFLWLVLYGVSPDDIGRL